MRNEFRMLFLFIILCLISCKSDHDTSLTDVRPITEEIALKDSLADEKPFSLEHPILEDSSKYYFFVENVAGSIDYQQYDFTKHNWRSVTSLFEKSFMGGPVHTGRIIYQRNLWRDSARYLLLAKEISRGMTIMVQPLAEIIINNDPTQSIFILIPERAEHRLSECTRFNDWFTYCNTQRFFVQYWIEQQFTPRYIKRILWKPFIIMND